MFCNLLSNAFKFTPRSGHIKLTAAREGDEVIVSIKDNGIGIPSHQLSAIFEMFTQLDRTLEQAQGGLGIGLTLVQRLVGMHGGSVTAHSDGPGKGAEFVVRLPIADDQAPPPENNANTASGSAPHESRLRVLVVDDNQDSANSLSLLLKLEGNEVETAHDGLRAIEAAERFRPEMILLDIGLPGLNGYNVARKLRELPFRQRDSVGGFNRLGAGGGPPQVPRGRLRQASDQAGGLQRADGDTGFGSTTALGLVFLQGIAETATAAGSAGFARRNTATAAIFSAA